MEKLKKILEENGKKLDVAETFKLHRDLVKHLTGEFCCIPMTKLEIVVLTAALKYIANAYESLLDERDKMIINSLNNSLTSYAGMIPAGGEGGNK